MRHFFRITGYYDLEGIDENGNPKFTKLAHNVKLTYNKDAESWVINNDGTNMAFAVSNAASPAHIDATKWNIRLGRFSKLGKNLLDHLISITSILLTLNCHLNKV